MPGDLPSFSCIVAFLISSRRDGSSSSSFKSTWGILVSEDCCTTRRILKRPSNRSDQRWRMAFLSVSRVLPSEERRGLRSDVRVRRRPSVPRRRRACYACVSMPLCPLGKSCPPIILHGPKLSLEFTAGSLVCSLGSFIIRFCKRMLVAKAFLFEQLLDFFLCFIKPILVFSGRQTSSLVFICFHCPSCSAAVKQ